MLEVLEIHGEWIAHGLGRLLEGLTEAEEQAAVALTRHYERFMLVRAEAASLLAQRGHDLSGILPAI